MRAVGLSAASRVRRALSAPLVAAEEIGLGHHDAVGDGGLLHRLDMGVERRGAVHGIDEGDDAVDAVAQHEIGVRQYRLQDRGGVGKAGRLDDDAPEGRDPAVVAALQQIFQRGNQVAPDRAAETTGRHEQHVAVDLLDQQMIEADLAELVDQDDGVRKFGRGKKLVEKCRLTRAEEPGEDRDRDRRRCFARDVAGLIDPSFSLGGRGGLGFRGNGLVDRLALSGRLCRSSGCVAFLAAGFTAATFLCLTGAGLSVALSESGRV